MTRDHVGERFAIVLDGKVVSAPFVRGAITGRVLRIEGGFSREDATRLAAALTGARLAMPFRIVEERVIERNRKE
jgi:preprotein translocase subunit SecD